MEMSKTPLPKLTRDDWILRFFRLLKLHPVGIFITVSIINIILDFCLAKGFNIWESNSRFMGLSREPGAWAIDFIADPLIFATYVWVNAMSGSLLTKLIRKKKIKWNNVTQKAIRRYSRQINSAWFSGIATVLGVIITSLITWFLLFDPVSTDWSRANNVIAIVRAVMSLPVYITGMLLLFYLVCFIFNFNKIITLSDVIVEPFHPDNAGGFGDIGHVLANIGYVILCFGFILVLVFYQSYLNTNFLNPEIVAGRPWLKGGIVYLVIYLILAPSAFFLPALSTHRVMANHKKELMSAVSKNIDGLLKRIYVNRLGSPAKVKPLIEKLSQLEHIREITLKYPTWPYNQGNLRKYVGLVLTPFFTTFLSIMANKLYTSLF
jgi:hypothetical protein